MKNDKTKETKFQQKIKIHRKPKYFRNFTALAVLTWTNFTNRIENHAANQMKRLCFCFSIKTWLRKNSTSSKLIDSFFTLLTFEWFRVFWPPFSRLFYVKLPNEEIKQYIWKNGWPIKTASFYSALEMKNKIRAPNAIWVTYETVKNRLLCENVLVSVLNIQHSTFHFRCSEHIAM